MYSKLTYHQCSKCGWLMTDAEYSAVKFDFGCPGMYKGNRCNMRLSNFIIKRVEK